MEFTTPGIRILARYHFLLPALAVAAVAALRGGWAAPVIFFFDHALIAWGVAMTLKEEGLHAGPGQVVGQLLLLVIAGATIALLLGAPLVFANNQPGWPAYALVIVCAIITLVGGLRFWPAPALVFASPAGVSPVDAAAGAIRGALALTRNQIERSIEGAPLFVALGCLVLVPVALLILQNPPGGSTHWWIVFAVYAVFAPFLYGFLFSEVAEAMRRSGRPRTPVALRSADAPGTMGDAVAAGDIETLRKLAKGKDVNTPDKGPTPLLVVFSAPAERRPDTLRALIDLGCDLSIEDERGNSALHLAAGKDEGQLIRILMEAGANREALDHEHNTALVTAAANASWQALRELCRESTARDPSATPAIHAAAMARRDDPAGVRMLLDCGAIVDQRGKLGRTALMGAAIHNNAAIAETLLKAGAQINTTDEFGNTPLIEAARAGANDVLRVFAKWKPKTEVRDKPGRTALLVAVASKRANAETVELLIKMGADPKTRNRDGRAAAELASASGRWSIANALGVKRSAAPAEQSSVGEDEEGVSVIDLKLFETAEDRAWAEARLQQRSRTQLSSATEVMPALDLDAELTEAVAIETDAAADRDAPKVDADAIVAEPPRQQTAEVSYADLLSAVMDDDVEKIADVLQRASDPPEWWLVSAFLNGVAKGHGQATRWLLENGLNPNARSEAGVSLLGSVVQQAPPDFDIIEALLDRGARCDSEPDLLLWVAGMADHQHSVTRRSEAIEHRMLELLRRLIEGGANVEATDESGRGALHWAVRYRASNFVNLLVEQGLAVDQGDQGGNTPLLLATHAGRTGVVRTLVRAGADPKQGNHKGVSPLSLAMERQDHNLGKLLMTSTAPAEPQQDNNTSTALLQAAAEGNLGRVKRLLAAGIDPDSASDKQGVTALIAAAGKGHADVVATLLTADADPDLAATRGTTALGAAVLGDHVDIVTLLCERGIAPDQPQQYGITPLALAAARWRPRMVATLLRLGADPGARDESDGTPLAAAVQNALSGGSIDAGLATIKFLLKAGADPNTLNDEGHSPLLLLLGVRARRDPVVSEAELVRLAQLLIDAGAKVEQQDLSGWSALHAAAAHGFRDVAALLMDSGCSRRIRDINGLSPVDLAMDNGHDDLVELFIERG